MDVDTPPRQKLFLLGGSPFPLDAFSDISHDGHAASQIALFRFKVLVLVQHNRKFDPQRRPTNMRFVIWSTFCEDTLNRATGKKRSSSGIIMEVDKWIGGFPKKESNPPVSIHDSWREGVMQNGISPFVKALSLSCRSSQKPL